MPDTNPGPFTYSPDASKPLFLPDVDEVRAQARMSLEHTKAACPPIPFRPLDRARTFVHRTYREAADPKYLPEVVLHVHVEPNPSRQQLRKIGIDKQRDILAKVSVAELDEKHLLQHGTGWMIGWRMRWDTDEYVIESHHRDGEAYFANTNISFFHVVTAVRARIRTHPAE